jgi:hypothetical protein
MGTIDEEQVAELFGRFVNDLGATTISAGNVLVGDNLGLYQALAEAGSLTPSELAAYTATTEPYVREWLPLTVAGRRPIRASRRSERLLSRLVANRHGRLLSWSSSAETCGGVGGDPS